MRTSIYIGGFPGHINIPDVSGPPVLGGIFSRSTSPRDFRPSAGISNFSVTGQPCDIRHYRAQDIATPYLMIGIANEC